MEEPEKPIALQANGWVWLGFGCILAIHEFNAGRYGTSCIGLAAMAFGLYVLWARYRLRKSNDAS